MKKEEITKETKKHKQSDSKQTEQSHPTHPSTLYSSSIVFLLSDLIPGECAVSNRASESGDLQNPGALVGSAHAALIFFRAPSTCLVYEAHHWSLSSADCMLRSMNDCVKRVGVGGFRVFLGGGRGRGRGEEEGGGERGVGGREGGRGGECERRDEVEVEVEFFFSFHDGESGKKTSSRFFSSFSLASLLFLALSSRSGRELHAFHAFVRE